MLFKQRVKLLRTLMLKKLRKIHITKTKSKNINIKKLKIHITNTKSKNINIKKTLKNPHNQNSKYSIGYFTFFSGPSKSVDERSNSLNFV